jgi:membrane protease YdiL (CAAX protease family)
MNQRTLISQKETTEQNNRTTKDSGGRTRALLEVITVFAAVLGCLWLTEWIPGFEVWQRDVFQRPIISTSLSIVILPLLMLMITGNSRTEAVVMNAAKLKEAFEIGGKSFSVMMPATFLSFPVVGGLGYSFYGWSGGLMIAAVHLLAIPCLLLLFRNETTMRESGFSDRDLARLLAVFIIAAGLIYGLQFIHEKISHILVMLVFVGFAEEFMFRGYIQGRLNRAFGKPYHKLGLSFGWGLLFASLLFGLMHALSPGNPLHWPWGLWAFVGGICFGIIREKGGSFLASALVHGFIMIFPVFFGM